VYREYHTGPQEVTQSAKRLSKDSTGRQGTIDATGVLERPMGLAQPRQGAMEGTSGSWGSWPQNRVDRASDGFRGARPAELRHATRGT